MESDDQKTFFCPYLGKQLDLVNGNVEHIVPGALGGTRELGIFVDRIANSTLGSEVDQPVTHIYQHRRVEFGLKGHSGQEPVFTADVTVDDLDRSAATWRMTAETFEVRLKTTVTKTRLPDGRTNISIAGDPKTAKRLWEDIRRAHEAKGRTLSEPTVVSRTIERPRVTGEFSYEPIALARFPVKVGLGIGHWLWGEVWSRGADAAMLRSALWCTTGSEIKTATQGLLWQDIEPTFFRMRIQNGEHGFVLARVPNSPTLLGVFPFGNTGWIIRLGDTPHATADPMLILLNVRTRALTKLTGVEIARAKRIDYGSAR